MTTVAAVAAVMDSLAPLATQMDWDNSGLLVGDPAGEVSGILVALDATLEVIREAQDLGAQMIVTHHPVIFHPVKQFLAGDPPFEAAVRGIAVYSAHTCYDMAEGGINTALAGALGLRNCLPLWEERPGDPASRRLGLAGDLPCAMTREELAAWVEEALGLPQNYVRHLPQAGPETVCRVAVCGGAGSDFLGEAVNAGCQAYLTGEVRRHEYLEAERRGLLLLDGGHFATENIAMPVLREQLAKALPEAEVRLSRQAMAQRPQALPPRG